MPGELHMDAASRQPRVRAVRESGVLDHATEAGGAMNWYRTPDGEVWHDDPHIEITNGPERIYDDNPKPDLPRRPIGFRVTEIQPLLWDGGSA